MESSTSTEQEKIGLDIFEGDVHRPLTGHLIPTQSCIRDGSQPWRKNKKRTVSSWNPNQKTRTWTHRKATKPDEQQRCSAAASSWEQSLDGSDTLSAEADTGYWLSVKSNGSWYEFGRQVHCEKGTTGHVRQKQ